MVIRDIEAPSYFDLELDTVGLLWVEQVENALIVDLEDRDRDRKVHIVAGKF